MKKKALITGITGQDGSYLAELLLSKDYQVHGLVRRASTFNTLRIQNIFQDPHVQRANLYLYYGDITDAGILYDLLHRIQPDEVYNLAAQSHVGVSFDQPRYTAEVVAVGTLNLLDAIRRVCPTARFYQGSSSEMYGKVQEVPQRETTPFWPRSPLAVAKLAAYWSTINYREAYGVFAANGILFNHEGPRRGETFVTRKITRGLANIIAGQQSKLYLGNLDARRDWGYAREYVEGIWLIMQAEAPDDFVLATGDTHTVGEFLEECCKIVGLSVKDVVEFDSRYLRPAEVDLLMGDATKAKRLLDWEPKTNFKALVRLMLAADLEAVGVDVTRYGLSIPEDKAIIQFPS